MKQRSLLLVALTLLFCFGVVLATGAAQPTAKDLVIASINNFNLGIDKSFYEKCRDVTKITVTEFDGSLTQALGQVKGSETEFISELDAVNNAIKVNYTTNISGNPHSGDIYLAEDKLIFTKDLFFLLRELGLDAFKDNPAQLEQCPAYLYLSEKQLQGIWEQMVSYQNQQLPQEYKDLMLFLVEAIPDEYFSLSTGKVTLTLDQNGMEEVIYNLVTKVKDEKERAADLVINLNRYSYEQMGMDLAQMRQQIITGIDTMPDVSREQITIFSSYVTIKDFTYEASLLPGGPKNFKMDLGFNAPDNSVTGQFTAVVDTAGTQGNMEGAYDISGNLNILTGPQVDFALTAAYKYRDDAADSDMTLKAAAKDNTSGELLLNLGATAKSTTTVEDSLVVSVPQLTDANSADLEVMFPELGQSLAPPVVETSPVAEQDHLQLLVNGSAIETDVTPAFGEGGLILPARAVLEALDCGVEWAEPNEVHVTCGDKTILLTIDSLNYQVNGLEKALSAPAYLEAGRTMIPESFLAEELGASVGLVNNAVVITK